MIMSSGVTIDQVYREIKKIRADMVKRKDLEALVDTVGILSNPATMLAIKKSDRDIRQGKVKTITSIDEFLNNEPDIYTTTDVKFRYRGKQDHG